MQVVYPGACGYMGAYTWVYMGVIWVYIHGRRARDPPWPRYLGSGDPSPAQLGNPALTAPVLLDRRQLAPCSLVFQTSGMELLCLPAANLKT